MHALRLSARVRIEYERSVETRSDNATDGVVKDTVTHARLGDMPQFRILDEKTRVWTMFVFLPD